MTDEEFWKWAANEWKLDKTPAELIGLLISGYDVDNKVVDIVKKVRRNGYKTLICSNNFPSRINGLEARFKFLDNFDAKALSYEIGATKPRPEIFRELIKMSGVRPEEIVYTDDNEISLSGAKELGITTFLYENFNKYLKQLKSIGVKI